MVAQHELQREVVGQVLGECVDESVNCTERAIQRLQSELWSTIERRFAELNARLDVLVSGGKARSEKFRFASEESPDVLDLPNPLPRRDVH